MEMALSANQVTMPKELFGVSSDGKLVYNGANYPSYPNKTQTYVLNGIELSKDEKPPKNAVPVGYLNSSGSFSKAHCPAGYILITVCPGEMPPNGAIMAQTTRTAPRTSVDTQSTGISTQMYATSGMNPAPTNPQSLHASPVITARIPVANVTVNSTMFRSAHILSGDASRIKKGNSHDPLDVALHAYLALNPAAPTIEKIDRNLYLIANEIECAIILDRQGHPAVMVGDVQVTLNEFLPILQEEILPKIEKKKTQESAKKKITEKKATEKKSITKSATTKKTPTRPSSTTKTDAKKSASSKTAKTKTASKSPVSKASTSKVPKASSKSTDLKKTVTSSTLKKASTTKTIKKSA